MKTLLRTLIFTGVLCSGTCAYAQSDPDDEPCAGAFEPNDSQSEATIIPIGTTYTAGLSSESDNDWYRVEIASTTDNTYSLIGPDGEEYDMIIYDSAGTLIDSGTTAIISPTETVTISSQPPGTYFIHIYGNSESCYFITVSSSDSVSILCETALIAFEPNESQAEATIIPIGTTYTAGLSSVSDNDWYRVETYSTANNTFNLVGPDGGDYEMSIYNSNGTLLGSATGILTLNNQASGTYFIHIYGDTTSCYTIAATSSEVASSCETDFEPNNSLAEATVIDVGPTHTAGLSSTSDYDYYRVETSSTSNNTYTMVNPDGADYGMFIYNSDGNLVAYDSAATANSATETVTINNQPPGTYFIFIANFGLIDSTSSCYTVTVSSSVCETAFEPNQSQAEAATIAVGTTYAAGLSSEWDEDWYRVETSSTANNTFSLVRPSGMVYGITIYNSDGSAIGSGSSIDGTTVTLNNQPPGTYFIYIYGFSASCYTITATSSEVVSSCEAFEPNNSLAEATTIAVGTTYTAGISSTSDYDYYRVETSFTANNTYTFVGPEGANYGMFIYNSDGYQVGYDSVTAATSATETVTIDSQPPGTYFIYIANFGLHDNASSCYTVTVTSPEAVSSCETVFEPNGSQVEATTIAFGTTYTAGLSPAWDVDWYRVQTSSMAHNTYSLVGPAGVDYDMLIFNSAGAAVGWASGTTADSASETLTLYNQAPGTYFIQIYGLTSAESTSCYSLTVAPPEAVTCDAAFEPNNDSVAQAITIAVGTTYTAGLSQWDLDWYRVQTTSTANNTYSLVGPAGADYDMIIYNSAGTLVGWGSGTTSNDATETLTINNQPPGTYFFVVYGTSYYESGYPYAGSTSCYSITVGSPQVASSCGAALEPNNSQAEALPIEVGTTYTAGLSSAADQDYYRVETYFTANNTYSLVGPDGADYDMVIYNSDWVQIGSGPSSGSATETVTINNQAPGTYFIKIYGYDFANSASCYTITVEPDEGASSCETAFEPNDSYAEAAAIAAGTTYTAGISIGLEDYYRLETSFTANNTYSLVAPDGVDLNMIISTPDGTVVGWGSSGGATETITINDQPPGTYFIRVAGSNFFDPSCYTITVTSSSSCEAAFVAFEPNGTQEDAATIAVGTTYTAVIFTQWDDDWYRVETSSMSNNTFSLFDPDGANLDMLIYNSAGIQVGSGITNNATETVTINNQPAGTYFIHIYGSSESCYTITIESSESSSCQTAFEPNDSSAQATPIAVGTTYTAGLSSGDYDWYRVETSSTADNTYSLVGADGADYDITIFNSNGQPQIGTGIGDTTNSPTETVTINNQAPGTYFILIYSYDFLESTSCYTIAVTSSEVASSSCEAAFEPNNSMAEAATIAYGTTYTAGLSSESDNDWYRVETSSMANNTYSLDGPDGADYSMIIFNSNGTMTGSAAETVTLNDQPPGTYFIHIYYNNSASCYTLEVAPAAMGMIASTNEKQEQTISVYPNPTNDLIYLSGSYAGKLTNQLGQTVKTFNGSEVSLKELQPGIYLLQVEGSPNLYKIVKE